MSKVSAHRHVTWAKQVTLGSLLASLCVTLGCSARATGDEDIIAISHEKLPSSQQRNTSSDEREHGTLSRASGSGSDPFLEPPDTSAAGSGSPATAQKAADAGSGAADAGTPVSMRPLGDPELGGARDVPRETVLFWVDAVGSRMWRARADGDGSDRRLLAGALSIAAPDGITVDLTDGFIYWTNMGSVVGGGGVGSLQRMRLDAEVVETVIPVGTTSTPKQINIDNQARQLYWSDLQAMVWRSELDGSDPEVLVSGHELQQPAGMALDVAKRQMYISDRMGRRLYRVGFDMPEGETAETRTDLETLVVLPLGAWPLNIALDLGTRKMYWTDRGRGVIYRMNMDLPAGTTAEERMDVETVVTGLNEPVGLAFDDVTKRLYFTELQGRVLRVSLDGSDPEEIVNVGSASGIALAHLPR